MKEISKAEQQSFIYDLFLPSLTYTPFSQLANLTGQPAISIPVHLSEQGLPLGVQIMALKGEEHRLLQIAYQIEQTELWVGMKRSEERRVGKEWRGRRAQEKGKGHIESG